ncbi:hypothetical protein [Ruminococcus sp.]
MDYLYKITIGIDDDKVLSMRQHDLNAVYKTVRNTFARCNFKEQEQESENGDLVFTIGKGKDSFSEVGIATGVLRESWLGKYLNKMEWYDSSDDTTEDVFKEIEEFKAKYGK